MQGKFTQKQYLDGERFMIEMPFEALPTVFLQKDIYSILPGALSHHCIFLFI